ncbi:MAG TPA: IS1380 family transposase [Desulfatiglandales bacterium]|nr:IS1380 family transposase [Desulfatiglandales bacterium]
MAEIAHKRVELDFEGGDLTSDAGALFLREVERQTGIIKAVAECIKDKRDQRYVKQELETLIKQRVIQIGCGYEDANDCNMLRHDPSIKMAADREPISGDALASQPTMSRFENAISRKDLVRIAYALANHFIASYREEPAIVVLDFDDTEDAVHGAQQLSLFNGYYGGYCYQPLHVYEGLSGKLITTILRPGKRTSSREVVAILNRLVPLLRSAWKETIIFFRGDSHFSGPATLKWLDDNGILYAIGQTKNSVLQRLAQERLLEARQLYNTTHRKVRLFDSFEYQADSWDKPRQVIVKAEITQKGENLRFIVTNIQDEWPQQTYDIIYCARGNMENNIKDHKLFLKSDRTSCNKFEANQFRLFLHSVAYILMHALRDNLLKGTEFSKATFATIRLRVLKIGALVRELKTKIKIHLPSSYPLKPLLERIGDIFKILRLSVNTA